MGLALAGYASIAVWATEPRSIWLVEFNRVAGLYIATLFVVWQVVSFIAFRSIPGLPVLVGGALIVAGGLLVTFWKR